MSRIGTINITQQSQNIANNTTTFLVECIITTTGESYRGDHRTGTVTVYSGSTAIHSVSFTHGAPTNTRTVLYSVTLTVGHNSDGTSPTITANYNYDSGWATGTATKTFATIPRQSSLSVSNGTLGVAQTLTVSRKSTSFTHTITVNCGGSVTTICSKSTSTSISFTPPMSWASKNTTGTTLSITYTITTYSGNTSVGSTNYVKTVTIPASVKPSVSFTVTEASDLQWGVYIQTKSKLKIVLTATTAYSSPISSYSTTVDGTTYTSTSFTTGYLKGSGTLTISVKVTDKRGRSATATQTIDVQAYGPPKITLLKVNRCNEDGSENMQGEYCKVTVSGTANALYDRYGVSNNTLSFRVESKKTSESTYTSHGFIGYGGIKGENTGELHKVIPTASNSSYNVRITAMDVFSETSQVTVLSSGFSLMHWLASGLGMAIGKIAELANVLDIGFQTRFMGGILQPVLENGTDFDTVLTPNTYTVKAALDSGYSNCPISSNTTGTLTVESCGDEGQTRQIFTTCSKADPMSYERYYYQGSWGVWHPSCKVNNMRIYSSVSQLAMDSGKDISTLVNLKTIFEAMPRYSMLIGGMAEGDFANVTYYDGNGTYPPTGNGLLEIVKWTPWRNTIRISECSASGTNNCIAETHYVYGSSTIAPWLEVANSARPQMRCGSKTVVVAAHEDSVVLFTSGQIEAFFGHKFAGATHYTAAVTNADAVNPAHVEGTTFANNNMYAVIRDHTTAQISLTVNYVIFYIP